MSFRERLDMLSRGEIAGLIVVLVAVLGGAGLWYARSLPKPVTIAESGPGAAQPAVSPTSSPALLIVDVAGAVRTPGVYEFAEGERVVDAIERAGGPRAKADLSLLNLAAPLVDGTQILVPKIGPAVAGVPGETARAPPAASSTSTRRRRPSWRRCRASAKCSPPRSSSTAPRTARSPRWMISWTSAGSARRRSRRSATRSRCDSGP
jgi:hypothetical protein